MGTRFQSSQQKGIAIAITVATSIAAIAVTAVLFAALGSGASRSEAEDQFVETLAIEGHEGIDANAALNAGHGLCSAMDDNPTMAGMMAWGMPYSVTSSHLSDDEMESIVFASLVHLCPQHMGTALNIADDMAGMDSRR